MRSDFRLLSFFLGAILLLAGCASSEITPCAGDEDCPDDRRCHLGTCTLRCERTADCDRGDVCISNLCVLAARCTASSDCRSDEVCEDRLCVPQQRQCSRSSECPPGFTCINGGCRFGEPEPSVPASCDDDGDCAGALICLDGVCADVDCVEDRDCSADLRCQAGRCIGDETSGTCTTTGDCTGGDICVAGACVPPSSDECANDRDCASDEVCEAGSCVPDTAPQCVRNSDCPLGEVCEEGSCTPEPSAECVRNSDCASDERCTSGRCVPLTDAGCREDRDCATAERCEGGTCVPVDCVRDRDCAAEEVCDEGSCISAPPECMGTADCGSGRICILGRCEDEPECQGDGDCNPDQICLNQRCECVGDGDRTLGQSCERRAQCCSGLCLGSETRPGVCTRPCTGFGDCQEAGVTANLICGQIADGRFCAPADFGSPCTVPGNCSGGICMGRLRFGISVERVCTWACTSTAECPQNSTCGALEVDGGSFINACIPMGEVCNGGNDGLDCYSRLCLGPAEPGLADVCTSECSPEQGRECGLGWTCAVVDASVPPVCLPPNF